MEKIVCSRKFNISNLHDQTSFDIIISEDDLILLCGKPFGYLHEYPNWMQKIDNYVINSIKPSDQNPKIEISRKLLRKSKKEAFKSLICCNESMIFQYYVLQVNYTYKDKYGEKIKSVMKKICVSSDFLGFFIDVYNRKITKDDFEPIKYNISCNTSVTCYVLQVLPLTEKDIKENTKIFNEKSIKNNKPNLYNFYEYFEIL